MFFLHCSCWVLLFFFYCSNYLCVDALPELELTIESKNEVKEWWDVDYNNDLDIESCLLRIHSLWEQSKTNHSNLLRLHVPGGTQTTRWSVLFVAAQYDLFNFIDSHFASLICGAENVGRRLHGLVEVLRVEPYYFESDTSRSLSQLYAENSKNQDLPDVVVFSWNPGNQNDEEWRVDWPYGRFANESITMGYSQELRNDMIKRVINSRLINGHHISLPNYRHEAVSLFESLTKTARGSALVVHWSHNAGLAKYVNLSLGNESTSCDICSAGSMNSQFYPLRHPLAKALRNMAANHNYSTCELNHPGYRTSTIENQLQVVRLWASYLRRCSAAVSTRSNWDYLLKKYFEYARHGVLQIGNVPSSIRRLVDCNPPPMVEVNLPINRTLLDSVMGNVTKNFLRGSQTQQLRWVDCFRRYLGTRTDEIAVIELIHVACQFKFMHRRGILLPDALPTFVSYQLLKRFQQFPPKNLRAFCVNVEEDVETAFAEKGGNDNNDVNMDDDDDNLLLPPHKFVRFDGVVLPDSLRLRNASHYEEHETHKIHKHRLENMKSESKSPHTLFGKEASTNCADYGLSGNWTEDADVRVYIISPFNTEISLLAFHLLEVYEELYKLILVESTKSFQGYEKPLIFDQYAKKHFPAKMRDKVRHLVISNCTYCRPGHHGAWDMEYSVRDFGLNGLYDARPWDLVVSADIDEVLSFNFVRAMRRCVVFPENQIRAGELVSETPCHRRCAWTIHNRFYLDCVLPSNTYHLPCVALAACFHFENEKGEKPPAPSFVKNASLIHFTHWMPGKLTPRLLRYNREYKGIDFPDRALKSMAGITYPQRKTSVMIGTMANGWHLRSFLPARDIQMKMATFSESSLLSSPGMCNITVMEQRIATCGGQYEGYTTEITGATRKQALFDSLGAFLPRAVYRNATAFLDFVQFVPNRTNPLIPESVYRDLVTNRCISRKN